MSRHRRHRRARKLVDSLERRQMFTGAWGATPTLIRLDDLAAEHPELTGIGQTIAVIDTGIDYNHPSLGGGIGANKKVIGGWDFVDNDATPLDTDGHGTGVAGVLAASEFEAGGFTYRGIAPSAKLVALRIARDTDAIPLNRIEDALQWVIANHGVYDFTAVNLSFGFGRFDSDYADDNLADELQQLNDLNIAFVSSAGNDGVSDGPGITYPAADANAFSVGSVSSADIVSEFSQRSANLDLFAPGEGVRTTGLGGTFVNVSGTSFAAPALAGTIALMNQVDEDFTVADLKSILRASSSTTYDGDNETGDSTDATYLRLNVKRTLDLALARRGGTSAQAALVGNAGHESDLIFDSEGILHFAWYDVSADTMRYATRSLSGEWSTPSNIDPRVLRAGTEFSMKLDSYGRPVVAYLDSPNGDLKVARFDGTEWTRETIDSNGVTGLYPSLAIDSNDRLYVSYFRKTNRDLKMATFDNGQWSRQTVDGDGDVGWSSTIRLDADENPAIAYGDAGRNRLKLARLLGSSWQVDVVDNTTLGAAYISLAFGEADRPVISYYEVQPADLKLATPITGGWKIERVATRGATGLYTNVELDDDGKPTILYWDRRSNSLNSATRNGNRFTVTRVMSGAGRYTMATRSTVDGRWNYAASNGSKLVLASL